MIACDEAPSARSTVRLLVVPGLHDSPPGHWQSWLEREDDGAVRVQQRDWSSTDVERWAARIASTIDRAGPGPYLAVAHSFGALALLRHLALQPAAPIAAVLLVAQADPDRFGIGELLPRQDLGRPTTVVLSHTDPWLTLAAGQRWAQRWRAAVVDLGQAGHINIASGHATLPFAQHWVATQRHRLAPPMARAESSASGRVVVETGA